MKKIKLLLLIFIISCSQGAQEEFQTGEAVYEARCSSCHGPELEGRVGPNMNTLQIAHHVSFVKPLILTIFTIFCDVLLSERHVQNSIFLCKS